jgi:hypothetical protein
VIKKMMMKSRSVSEGVILKRLSAGLSAEEIRRVLAGALNLLDQTGVDSLLERLGSETGTALRRVLGADNSKIPPVPSRAKIKEEWKQAWDDWDSRIAQACDSEGDDVIQEHHWEEPYFDPQSVADDLEPIAARMKKLLPHVFDENIDPNFSFAQAVQDSMEEIKLGQPDWMDPFANEGFGLGPEATACLIDWEWRVARRGEMTDFQFLDQLCELEQSIEGLSLDEKVVARFIRGLSAEAKNNVLRGIQAKRDEKPWKQALDSAHSGWFQIYKELCRSQDPPAYFENCRAGISQDWTLALPVAKHLESKKEYVEILGVCAAALGSFLRVQKGAKWELRKELLVVRAGNRLNGKLDVRLQDLLKIWARSARALQKEEIAVAASLQSDLLEHWRNWDKAIAAFRRVPQPRFAQLRICLFTQWRGLVAERSLGSVLYGPYQDPPPNLHWVYALADAAWEEECAQDSFCAWLRQWLNAIERDNATLRRSLVALARLSLDVDSGAWLSSVSPTMARLLADNQNNDPSLRASRRKWLKRLGASSLAPELLAFWRRNLWRLVPDPASNVKSDYKICANWTQALRELNPTSCKDLLRQWSVTHRRRKNLWRALQAKGLSIPGGK